MLRSAVIRASSRVKRISVQRQAFTINVLIHLLVGVIMGLVRAMESLDFMAL